MLIAAINRPSGALTKAPLGIPTHSRYNVAVMAYQTPKHSIEVSYEVKKSKFIAFAAPARNREEAMNGLEAKRQQYPDARHHCWAYLIGKPSMPTTIACSDDGEPSGTAGKPILNVLQHNTVGNVVIVVTRYFGGIKLGAGGLVRAYSQASQQVISQLPVITHVPMTTVNFVTDFKHEQQLRHFIQQVKGHIQRCHYTQVVTLQANIPSNTTENVHAQCLNSGISFTLAKGDS